LTSSGSSKDLSGRPVSAKAPSTRASTAKKSPSKKKDFSARNSVLNADLRPLTHKNTALDLKKSVAEPSDDSKLTQTKSSGLKPMSTVKEVVTGNVRVFCRFRPLNKRELGTKDNKICVQFKSQSCCAVKGVNKATGQVEPINYNFDAVFNCESRQETVFKTAVEPIVSSVLEGFNGTILAYGQTSSGKTHTMQGPDIDDQEMRGIIPRMVGSLFQEI